LGVFARQADKYRPNNTVVIQSKKELVMIIKPSINEREFLKQQLLKLIKENDSDLSHASDDDTHAGLATLFEDSSFYRALVNRAIEQIRNAVGTRRYLDKHESYVFMDVCNEYLAKQEEEEKMDSIGPELLGVDMDDQVPF
jgi:hypothetical protein